MSLACISEWRLRGCDGVIQLLEDWQSESRRGCASPGGAELRRMPLIGRVHVKCPTKVKTRQGPG